MLNVLTARRARAAVALLLAPAALVMAGCGPEIAVTTVSSAAPRASNCELEFRKFEMSELGSTGPWEVLGYVAVVEEGVQDPLKESNRAEVRPRACAMGGEAVGIVSQATVVPGGMSRGGTSVSYVVVRRRPATTKASGPTKF